MVTVDDFEIGDTVLRRIKEHPEDYFVFRAIEKDMAEAGLGSGYDGHVLYSDFHRIFYLPWDHPIKLKYYNVRNDSANRRIVYWVGTVIGKNDTRLNIEWQHAMGKKVKVWRLPAGLKKLV